MITLLLQLLVLLALINVSYWVLLNYRVSRLKNTPTEVREQPQKITLLICVKNAYTETVALLKQIDILDLVDYDVDVLIVDDYSDPPLGDHNQTLVCRYPIKIIKAGRDIAGKKSAIHSGILDCKDGIILLTDVDCIPSTQWVTRMANATVQDRVTLGYSPFIRHKTSINKWARYENVITAVQYIGWALLGRPYMGVGRNMALTKSAVSALTLDDLHPHVPGGDDDMIVQYIGQASVCLDAESYVFTEAPSSWQSYFAQKRRHYAISTHYPLSTKVILSLYSLSQIGVFVLSVFGLLLGLWKLVFIIWMIRMGLMLVSSINLFKRFEQLDLWYWLPMLDVVLSLYYIVFGFTFLLPKSKQW